MPAPLLDPSRIRAISLDLDDTLWPVAPTIERARAAMLAWLAPRAPATAKQLSDAPNEQLARQTVLREQPELAHDLGAQRLQLLRLVLRQCGEDTAWAEGAFQCFHQARQQVFLYEDSLPTLAALAARYPLVALTNGNADVQQIGIGHFFCANLRAGDLGFAKPDPRMFALAAQSAGVRPEQVLHIGDDATLDGLGALTCGMQFAWIDRHGQTWPHATHLPHSQTETLSQLLAQLSFTQAHAALPHTGPSREVLH